MPLASVDPDQPRLWIFYHYLYPDDVVSAVHMDQLAEGFAQSGWQVTGWAANRGCRNEETTYPPELEMLGVTYRHLWRPPWRQATSVGRLLNAIWMIVAWSLLTLSYSENIPDAILIGTDPILSVTTALAWKLLRPRTAILHWCFDLYPEAAYADGLLSPSGKPAGLLNVLLKHAYSACDAIVDIGPCMRQHLLRYESPARHVTVVPWALEEAGAVLPQSQRERQHLGGQADLLLLYSGTFGRAHIYQDFLSLAQVLASESVSLTFSIRGNRETELRQAVDALPNGSTCPVRFVDFASADRLLDRLTAPDVHLLSLAADWAGLVVPSKFFGALAVGRPVLFSGSTDTSIARWIQQYDLGWVISPDNAPAVAADLMAYIHNPARVRAMQQRCFDAYRLHFSRHVGTAIFNRIATQAISSKTRSV